MNQATCTRMTPPRKHKFSGWNLFLREQRLARRLRLTTLIFFFDYQTHLSYNSCPAIKRRVMSRSEEIAKFVEDSGGIASAAQIAKAGFLPGSISYALESGAIEKLKLKSIEDFKKLIKQISYGYRPSYRNLLNQICFIEVHSQLDNSELIYEQYINNELQ